MDKNKIMRSMFLASQKKYRETNDELDDPNDDLYIMDDLIELYKKNGDSND